MKICGAFYGKIYTLHDVIPLVQPSLMILVDTSQTQKVKANLDKPVSGIKIAKMTDFAPNMGNC